MIPLEAARLGIESYGFDYSPVAVLASNLLSGFPFEDWSSEPELPFGQAGSLFGSSSEKLLNDVTTILDEVGERHARSMAEFYPPNEAGNQPWGYLWAVSIPCQECGIRLPLVGSYELNRPRGKAQSQSFRIESLGRSQGWKVVVHTGAPEELPTLRNAILDGGRKAKGKSAVCPCCLHVHSLETHRRLVNDGQGEDVLLLVADIDDKAGKNFRQPTEAEGRAAAQAAVALREEAAFSPLIPAIPDEGIRPGNNNIIGPSIYGTKNYGQFMVDRQTLSYIRLARIISDLGDELAEHGFGSNYVRALCGYATAVVVKKLRRSTRGARMQAAGGAQVGDLFVNEGSITFSHDFFEAGIGQGPGTWTSIAKNVLSVLRSLTDGIRGRATVVARGSATSIPLPAARVTAVVTDPPYDAMIAYADASDLFYAWIKRCLFNTWPELAVTADPYGAQDKTLEIIVKRQEGTGKLAVKDHRTREHYDTNIQKAFAEMRRVVQDDGLVTIVFGHGNPEVWQRLLDAISHADLVMTASWPANTEAGGSHGNAHIETTLTMACRPAPIGRSPGRKGAVEAAIKSEIKRRYPDWERWGLAPADMLMAAAGPAMEVVGRYSEVLDATGSPVDIHTFLPLARAAVQEAMAVEVDHHPLETFDARTRFALWWVRLYGRQVQAKSELRWQCLAASLDSNDVRDLVPQSDKGVCFTLSRSFDSEITDESAAIDVALALANASEDGIASMGEVLARSGRGTDDAYLWATIKFLADRLPDSDPDAIAFTRVLRTRDGIAASAEAVNQRVQDTAHTKKLDDDQLRLM
jgi:putative DNA methylase